MSPDRHVQVLIAGAGMAGLSAAYHLGLMGRHDFAVLEAQEDAGGIARSFRTPDGFVFDYGSHILYTKSAYVARLYRELLGENIAEHKRDAWIYSKGRFTRYPFQSNLYGLPLDVVEECLLGFIEAREQGPVEDRIDFETWVNLTYGPGIAKHFMLPFNEKQWKFPLNKMSHAWVGNRVVRPSLEDVIHGAFVDNQKGFGPNQTFIYPATGGVGLIPARLLERLGADAGKLITAARIESIDHKKKIVQLSGGEIHRYEHLVYTLPLTDLPRLLENRLPDRVRQALQRLEYVRMYCLFFGVKGEPLTRWMRLYLPEKEFLAHRLGFPQTISASLAPSGWGSVYAEITEARAPAYQMSEEEMASRTIADLNRIGIGGESGAVEYRGRVVVDPAYVIYTLTHSTDVEIIHKFLLEHDIHPAGRFADWRYYNIDHTILSGKAAVEKIVNKIGRY